MKKEGSHYLNLFTCDLSSLTRLRPLARRQGRHECRAFEQAAEILFARVLMFAVGKLEIRRGFVADFEPFELNNADVFVAAFPDLALLKFHRWKIHLFCYLIQARCWYGEEDSTLLELMGFVGDIYPG